MRDPHPAAGLKRDAAAHAARGPGRRGAWCALLLVLIPASAGADADVVARVNGVAITEESVNEVVKSIIVERGGTPPSSTEIAELNDAALDSLINLELLYQAAVQREIRVSDADVQAEIARSKARLGGDEAFDAALRRSGMDQARLVAETRKTLMVERLVDQLIAGTQVTQEAVRRFYDEHPDEFRHGEQVHVRELVIPVPAQASSAERDQARQTAADVRAQLGRGAEFAPFAARYGVDPASSAAGGDRGFVGRTALRPEVAPVAFSLSPGKLSEVIEAGDGFHIVQVVARRPAGVVPFERARRTIEQALRESERRQRQDAYLAELRQQARIERATPVPN